MGLFTRRNHQTTPQPKPSVEIVAHKKATSDQVEEVKKANDSLQKVLDANHFTIKIYLASGGSRRSKKKAKG